MRNRYPGACTTCSTEVAAQSGTLRREDGRWRVYCAEHTPVDPPPEPPAAPPPPRGDHPGWHVGDLAGFDCETSSNDPRRAFLVSAALTDTTGTTRSWLVDPGDREIPADAIAVHGITTERARAEGIPAEKALKEITEALVDHLLAERGLVIFNAPFDLSVLATELRRHGMPTIGERLAGRPRGVIDPLVIDRGIDPHRKGARNLGAMCAHYGVELAEAHTAHGDALACLLLAREIGARYPDLAALELPALHERQVAWAAEHARRFQEWLDRRRPGHGRTVDGTWPGDAL